MTKDQCEGTEYESGRGGKGGYRCGYVRGTGIEIGLRGMKKGVQTFEPLRVIKLSNPPTLPFRF